MRPFLKWAGGKYRIIDRIKATIPNGTRLVEPFVGSGTLFLNTEFDQYLLADINNDLINLYKIIQKEGLDFIDYSEEFFSHENNTKEKFYTHRNLFNTTDELRLKSALFLYLNRHCFNGLCRYNSKGEFNVPFGRYKKPYFPRKEMSYFFEKSQNAEFVCTDFEELMISLTVGDVVYCDPPYVPLSETANFASYSASKFNFTHQIRLARIAEELAEKNIPVLISNHETEFTIQEYQNAEITSFKVQRCISSNGAKREKSSELLALFGAGA